MSRMTQNNLENKLDVVLEKVSKIEVYMETIQSELKATKSKVESHETDINRMKGALLLVSVLGIFGTIKAYLHLG